MRFLRNFKCVLLADLCVVGVVAPRCIASGATNVGKVKCIIWLIGIRQACVYRFVSVKVILEMEIDYLKCVDIILW